MSAPRSKLPNQILIGLLFGAALGVLARAGLGTGEAADSLAWWTGNVIAPVGRVFIRLIFMVVIPLLVSAIILGVLEMGNLRELGRIGFRSMVTALGLGAVAVALALSLVNLIRPGQSIGPEARAKIAAEYRLPSLATAKADAQRPLAESLLDLIPQNPLAEAVNAFSPHSRGTELLALMGFSLVIGVALSLLPGGRGITLRAFLQDLFDVCMRVIDLAMRLAPLGVACLAFSLTSQMGMEILRTLALYAAVVLGGLILQMFVVYPLALILFARKSPALFFSTAREAIVTAFGTSSSNATLPVSLRVAEGAMGIPRAIGRFVLTVGATANQNGTALYEGVTVLFLAQVVGVELSLQQQLLVAMLCIVTSIGTAGVPGGSLPLVAGVLATVGVDPQAIVIILGIDRFLDMCRTVLNVTGDLVIAEIVAASERGRLRR